MVFCCVYSWQAAIARVDALMLNRTRALGLPGAVLTVTFGQQQVFFKGYGKRDKRVADSPPPMSNDLVWVASITKTFTSLLLFILRDQGLVTLADPITAYMPTFSVRSIYSTAVPTLRQLASHTSGLPRETPFVCADCPPPNETAILTALATRFLVVEPNTRFHYSNLGFGLLGRALAHAVSTARNRVPLFFGCQE
jgi:CubicO group peptidase (beta-lactamase class C family)